MYLYPYYHWFSRKLPPIPSNHVDWPKSWSSIRYKMYEGVARYPLSRSEGGLLLDNIKLKTVLADRKSRRNFTLSDRVSEDSLGALLQLACGRSKVSSRDSRRVYPSAGGLYPVEIYVLLQRQHGNIPPGVFHYRGDLHELEEIVTFSKTEEIPTLFNYPWTKEASGAICLTGIFRRATQKYGERGYRFTLLEAGHIGQNIYLVGCALGLKIVGMGGTRDKIIEELLGIDGVSEAVVHAVIFG